MHRSLEMLVRGNDEIVGYYRTAAERWNQIWQREAAQELATFGKLLKNEQTWFEENCGGGLLSQEIMVVSGLVGLYRTRGGFGDNLERARLLSDAIQISSCSIGVKVCADKVARSYALFVASAV